MRLRRGRFCLSDAAKLWSSIEGLIEVEKEPRAVESGIWRWKWGCWCARPSLAGPQNCSLATTQPCYPIFESSQHFLGCSARWCCCLGFREEFVSWSSADGPGRRINAYSINCISLWLKQHKTPCSGDCGELLGARRLPNRTRRQPKPWLRWAKAPPEAAAGLKVSTQTVRSHVL